MRNEVLEFRRVRLYPWISLVILAALSLSTIVAGYFPSPFYVGEHVATKAGATTITALIFALVFTWAIILTPVIAASQKMGSFISLYRINFKVVDLAWGLGILVANAVFGVVWNQICLGLGWIAKKDKVGNVSEFVTANTHRWGVLIIVLGAVIAPLCEELYFRGLLYSTLRLRFRTFFAVVISATCFTLVHVQGERIGDLTTLPIILILGCLLAYVREKTDRLTPTICGHMMINLVAYISALYFVK